ncbi:MAG TPA: hypothetical protein PKH39_17815 [Woeseiaceae bacterium]|nr:hypothetical protein [Woeseiaceae bacterium]
MAEPGDENKSSSAVWSRLNQHGDEISALARAHAATEASLTALAKSVEAGFAHQADILGQLIEESRNQREKSSRPVNYFAWFTGALGVLAMFGGYTVLFNTADNYRLNNVESRSERHTSQLNERAFILGQQSEAIAVLKAADQKQYDLMLEFSREIGRLEGSGQNRK